MSERRLDARALPQRKLTTLNPPKNSDPETPFFLFYFTASGCKADPTFHLATLSQVISLSSVSDSRRIERLRSLVLETSRTSAALAEHEEMCLFLFLSLLVKEKSEFFALNINILDSVSTFFALLSSLTLNFLR